MDYLAERLPELDLVAELVEHGSVEALFAAESGKEPYVCQLHRRRFAPHLVAPAALLDQITRPGQRELDLWSPPTGEWLDVDHDRSLAGQQQEVGNMLALLAGNTSPQEERLRDDPADGGVEVGEQ